MPQAKRLHALAEHLRTLAGSLDDRPCNILRYITRPSLGRVERDHSARMIELTGQEISLPLAQQVLKNVLDHAERAVTIETIQKFVAEYYKLKLVDLKSRNNSKSVAMPRQVAMYLCKSLTHASLPEIGRSFGGKHHSTVIHSIKKVDAMRKQDGHFNTLINSFLENFR